MCISGTLIKDPSENIIDIIFIVLLVVISICVRTTSYTTVRETSKVLCLK